MVRFAEGLGPPKTHKTKALGAAVIEFIGTPDDERGIRIRNRDRIFQVALMQSLDGVAPLAVKARGIVRQFFIFFITSCRLSSATPGTAPDTRLL